jgi:4-amino-4-deoxy-L-arabinose transferase-like glycosyltransferase
LALVVLLWWWLQRRGSADTAAHAVLVLAVSYLTLRHFRSAEADALLLLFTAGSCMLGHALVTGKRGRGLQMLFGLCLGLGFLSKGPAAIAIPLLTLLAFTFLERRADRPPASWRAVITVPVVLTMLVTGFAWYAWILVHLHDAGSAFFGRQVDETFISGNHAQPVWWYLPRWFEFYAPWSVLIVPAALHALQRIRRGQEIPPIVRFCWVWLLTTLLLLSATINKQTQYALLLAPPAAVVLGNYLATAEGRFRWLNRGLFLAVCLVAVGAVAWGVVGRNLAMAALPWLLITAIAIVTAIAAGMRGAVLASWIVAVVSAVFFHFGEAHLSREAHKTAAQRLMHEQAAREPLFQLSETGGDGALSFYAGKVVPALSSSRLAERLAQHAPLWIVTEGNAALVVPAGVEVVREAEVGDLVLLRLSRP